jgi:queuine tRNA-ribosyltransferase
MPVGTLGTVKALTPADVRATGARVVLSNTYHLSLQPGIQTVARLGGLHAFMRWDGPMLTDSGGFQVFSLGSLRQVTDDGVTFASHLDGAPLYFSPERVIAMEEQLGADLIVPLDECVAANASRLETEVALERTQRWFWRSLSARTRDDQALFALLQGGMFTDLRTEAARAAAAEPAPGFAIGGLSVGEPKALTGQLLQATIDELPADKPRYLMGVGHPQDIVTYARLGVDLFDCVLPTRLARNGAVWSDREGGRLDLSRRALLDRTGPILSGCACPACTCWSVGALAALFQVRDGLAYRLASAHNLTVLADIEQDLRQMVNYTAQNTVTTMARKALHR